MPIITESTVRKALSAIKDPLLHRDYLSLNAVDAIAVENGNVAVDLCLGFYAPSHQRSLALFLQTQLEAMGFPEVEVRVRSEVLACPDRNNKGQLGAVKNVVMVASGKGGVGKSTTAVNLALALHAEGAKVGLLDADIYGPSQGAMLGVADGTRPDLVDGKYLKPISRMGIKSMSVAYMSAEKTPMVWRGSMAVRALQQLLEQTLWGEVDYLIIDMPPGTGDIQISLAQQLSVSGAVVVSTPQEVALIDARKGIEMFNKVGIPVLGVVENMSTHVCSSCGHADAIFGADGAARLAADYQVALLGQLPLNTRIREDVDLGLPTMAKDPTGSLARAYISLGNKVAAELWLRNLQQPAVPELLMLDVSDAREYTSHVCSGRSSDQRAVNAGRDQ